MQITEVRRLLHFVRNDGAAPYAYRLCELRSSAAISLVWQPGMRTGESGAIIWRLLHFVRNDGVFLYVLGENSIKPAVIARSKATRKSPWFGSVRTGKKMPDSGDCFTARPERSVEST